MMKLIWRATICTFLLLVFFTRAQDTGVAGLLNISCDPTCLNCAVFNTPQGCTSCNGDAFILTGSQGVCLCQGAAADNTTCTPQNTYQGGSILYSLMGNFSPAIANEWGYTAPIVYCDANQALLNLSAQNPNVTYNFPNVTIPTHQVVVANLRIQAFFPGPNPSINVTLSSNGFSMTRYYNSSTTGLTNGACGINGTAYVEDTVTFSFQDTNQNPNFSISVQADSSSWVGIHDFQFQTSNCSSNCAGSCSGPGANQCLQCPVGSIGPVNGVCTCLDNSTVLPNGSCSGVSNLVCPYGCNRCSNFGNGVPQCYQCLPGYSLLLVEDGLNQLGGVCIANNALITNNHVLAGPACHPSCRQCYGRSQYQCSACWANFTLSRIGDVSHCVAVTGVSADNLTSDTVVASTNLSLCQVSWTSKKVCSAITEQYLSNLQADHWLAANGTQQQMYIQTEAPSNVCETCMLVQWVYVYPNQTTLALDYQVTSVDVGLGMQNITYSANFSAENITAWNCSLSSDNATKTWYTCSFQLIFTTLDNSTASYDFNITSYVNYQVNGSIDIVDIIGAELGSATNDTELCADTGCTSVRNNSIYTNNESAIAQVCLPESLGNNLTLTKSNITAVVTNPNGTFTSYDITNQVSQVQTADCVTYTIPLNGLPVGNVTFLIQSQVVPWTGGRRLLQAAEAPPVVGSLRETSLNIYIDYPPVKDYTPVSYSPSDTSQVPRQDTSDQGTTWWIVGASILGGAILITLLLIIYMAFKEHSVRKRGSRSDSRKLSDLQPPTGIRVLTALPQQPSGGDLQPRRPGSVEQPTTVVVPQVTTLPAYIPQEPQSAKIPAVKMNKQPSGGFIV